MIWIQRIGDSLDTEIKRWAAGKEGNLRALLSTLQYVRLNYLLPFKKYDMKWKLELLFHQNKMSSFILFLLLWKL